MRQHTMVQLLFGASLASIFASSAVLPPRQGSGVYAVHARAAIGQLQQSYDSNNGLYGNLWWNSANVITMLADFQLYFPSYVNGVTATVFPTTLSQAPAATGNTNFLNEFYDDELWWAIAWITVYDVTKDNKYLDAASVIFENAKAAWGTSPCGGLWWSKAHISDNAIENSLYLTAAAKLANRKPSTPSNGYYLNEALKAYKFLTTSGLINSQNLINDGLFPKSSAPNSCKNNNGPTWTYNQGALLPGLAELTWSTGDRKYTDLAVTIASAAMDPKNGLVDRNGILHDVCEKSNLCAGDGGQFKGVFARGVTFLVQRANLDGATNARFAEWLRKNADSLWANDRSGMALGPVWSGPYSASSVQTQSSALDALVGAACVS